MSTSDPTRQTGPVSLQPGAIDELLKASQAAQARGDFHAMLSQAEQAHDTDAGHFAAALRLAECRLICGQVSGAISLLKALQPQARNDPARWQGLAELYTQTARHADAYHCHQRSVALQPGNPRLLYNQAASAIALGKLDEADRLLTEVIRLDPKDYDAWQNRSTLKRQTPESNHVQQLNYVLDHLPADDPGRVAICYALAKELEDLQQNDAAFGLLQQGASARRRRLNYEVAEDESAMQAIAAAFDRDLLQRAPPAQPDAERIPVFVLGLPRSGTTLVDRIISAHPQAGSLGESNTLAFAMMRAVSALADGSGAVQSKTELIQRSTGVDFPALGQSYLDALWGYGDPHAWLVDKTPLNFLYLGLIRLALPQAKIVHLRRHPLDSCYAIYKTLFRMGYPFSYSLQDVGRYYIAYHRLMQHWRQAMPGFVLDVDYEQLVTQPEPQSWRLLSFCGLDWRPEVLDFHRSKAPAATASAAQVRQPVYTSSVGLWRRYERQLTPLARQLEKHGIAVD